MSKSLLRSGFKWLDPAKLYSDKCGENNLRGSVLELGPEYSEK